MRHTRTKPLALFASLFLLAAGAARAQDERSRAVPAGAPEIAYTVSMPRPHTHLFEVEARLRYASSAPQSVQLVMPVWTPGSYLVREFERHVQDFAAQGEGGRALDVVQGLRDLHAWNATSFRLCRCEVHRLPVVAR